MPEDTITDLKQYIAELESLVEDYHALIFKHSPDYNPVKLLLMLKTDKITERGSKLHEDLNQLGRQAALELMLKIFICYDAIKSETTPKPIRESMSNQMERYRVEMREMTEQFRASYPASEVQ